jgi:uncharacterized protein YbbC (DUF1343 family)
MKKTALIAAAVCLVSLTAVGQTITIKTGIEVLKGQGFEPLKGKRVGLITNPTGVDNNLTSTIDILHAAPEVELVALFAPEHGVRGDAHAGDDVGDQSDPRTGLPVHSIYGRTRTPTPEMLRGLDALVYDIQDIGCRSYTFISSMGLAMKAAAENGIEFIVLDRPNPLGGLKVEGSVVEDGFFSFVSQFPIPYLYGLTCGELALLLNGEGMLGEGVRCDLTVVGMKGWRRSMTYGDTGLQWIAASPHIPQPVSALMYPASGIAGELNWLSIGVGYTIPFQMFAAEWMEAPELADSLNGLGLPGVHFRPIYFKPFYAFGQGKDLQGVQIHITDYAAVRLSEIQFWVMQQIARLYPGRGAFEAGDPGRFRMFDQVTGSDRIRLGFSERNLFSDIRDYWRKDEASFRQLAAKYYLYE